MCQIALNIPEEVLYDTKMNQEQANQFARQAVALGYYTQSGVSIGYCSQIAGMTEEEFLTAAVFLSILKFQANPFLSVHPP